MSEYVDWIQSSVLAHEIFKCAPRRLWRHNEKMSSEYLSTLWLASVAVHNSAIAFIFKSFSVFLFL